MGIGKTGRHMQAVRWISGDSVRERKSGRQQQHTPCPGCARNEKYLEMTAIW